MRNESSTIVVTSAYADKFLSLVEAMPDGCHEWRGMFTGQGYGVFNIEVEGRQRRFAAHRVAYALRHGGDVLHNRDAIVRHKCDNPACVNPDHLEIGSHWDNVRDRCERNRTARGQQNGRSKFGDAGARVALYLLENSMMTPSQLARIAQVDPASVRHLRDGITWRHIRHEQA